MVYQISLDSNFDVNKKNDFSFTDKNYKFSFTKNENIFVGDEIEEEKYYIEETTKALEEELLELQDKNGYKMNLWDKFKGAIGVGASSKKCEETIEEYKKGKISLEEAIAEIENYGEKQESSLNLFSNILTSFVAIGAATAFAVVTGGTGAVALAAVAAGSGAIAKAGTKLVDRATNKVENDELDAKQIGKDMLSGAVTGAIAQVTMGTGGSTFESGASAFKNIGKGAINSAKTGLKAGAISGASNYTIECAFEEDKKFNIKDFATTTITNSVVSGTVGAIVGGANSAIRSAGINLAGGSASATSTGKDILANGGCSTAHKILNDRIRNS